MFKYSFFLIFTIAPRSNDSDQYGRQVTNFQLSYSVSRQNQTPLVLSSGLVNNNNNNKGVTNSNISKSNLYSGKLVYIFLLINTHKFIRSHKSLLCLPTDASMDDLSEDSSCLHNEL